MVYLKHTGIYVENLSLVSGFYKNVFNMSAICENQIDSGELYEQLYGFPGAVVKITKLIAEAGEKNGYGDMLELIEIGKSDDNISDFVEKTRYRRYICQIGETHIAIGVDDIEETQRRIKLYGGKMLTDIVKKGNRKCCFCSDPEGNFIEIIE